MSATRRTLVISGLVVCLAALADAAPAQVTASAGDSRVTIFAPGARGLGAIVSDGDLTPGAPGNADGFEELFLVKVGVKRRATVQATNGDADVDVAGFDRRARHVGVTSRGDLVPGGNADGSAEVFVAPLPR